MTNIPDCFTEFEFQTSRSGGPGGQNVNKVSSKVALRFNIEETLLFTSEQKELIYNKLTNKISAEGILQIVSQVHRNQLQNKEETIKKFYALIEKAFFVKPIRKPSKPTKGMIESRIKEKKIRSIVKKNRGKNINEE